MLSPQYHVCLVSLFFEYFDVSVCLILYDIEIKIEIEIEIEIDTPCAVLRVNLPQGCVKFIWSSPANGTPPKAASATFRFFFFFFLLFFKPTLKKLGREEFWLSSQEVAFKGILRDVE